jgi:hypothetical protein
MHKVNVYEHNVYTLGKSVAKQTNAFKEMSKLKQDISETFPSFTEV